jgi:O-antigen/teichoic acid export membrane protein
MTTRARLTGISSLYRNAIWLLLNHGLTSLTGFGFWIVCARLFPQSAVGYATSLISAAGLCLVLSSLGLNRAMIRFLPVEPQATKSQLVLSIAATMATLSLIAGGVLLLELRRIVGISPSIILIVGVLPLIAFGAIKAAFDGAFTASRAARITLIETTGYNALKLMFLPLVVALGFEGIILVQAAAMVGGVLICLWYSRRFFPDLLSSWSLAPLRGKVRFSLGAYTADLVGGLPQTLMPIIVLRRLGPATSAEWYMAAQIMGVFFFACAALSQSMQTELAHRSADARQIILKAFRFGAIIVIGSGVVVAAAPLILSVFGPQYEGAATALRILAAPTVLVLGSYLGGGALLVAGKVRFLVVANIANTVVVLVLAATVANSLVAVGLIWVIGEVVNVSFYGGGALYFSRRRPALAAAA